MSSLKETIELLKENIEWVFDTVVDTLTRPRERYSIVQSGPMVGMDAIRGSANSSAIDLVPQIWIFGIFNILIGTLLFGASIDMAIGVLSKIVVVTLICWTLYSLVLHAACKLLGGASNFKRTLAVSIQVLSIAFVLSSFAGFIATRAFEFLNRAEGSERKYANVIYSLTACLAIQGVLLVVYWTVSLRSVHKITGWVSFLVVPITVIVFMLLNFVLFGALFFPNINGLIPHT